LKAFKLSIQWT